MRGQYSFTRNNHYVVLTKIGQRYRDQYPEKRGKWEIEVSRIRSYGGTSHTRLRYSRNLLSAVRTALQLTKKRRLA